MGKIIYEPKKQTKKEELEEMTANEPIKLQLEDERYNALIENIDSVKPVGDTDCDYTIYLEDYVYTYIYQYASTDLACEHSAAIIGEYYPENNEVIICGIMPVRKDKLVQAEEWINEEALEEIYLEKEKYFPGAMVLGWLHMQPGYGTMLTMKEVKVHRDLFNRQGSILLLVDPVNRIETFYIYEGEQLIEQTGYYIYYDKNTNMQQYMLDKPFVVKENEEEDDGVVTQFREIGRMRKKEYQQRKRANFTVIAASVALLAMTAVIIRVGNQNKQIDGFKQQIQSLQEAGQTASTQNPTSQPTVVIQDQSTLPTLSDDTQEGVIEIIDNTQQVAKEEAKEEVVKGSEQTAEPELEIISVTKEEDTQLEEADVKEKAETQEIEVIEPNKVEKEEVKIVEETEVEEVAEIAVEDYKTYVVQAGDSLRSISYDHFQTETRTKDIIKLNDIQDGDVIYVGEELKIPNE